MAWWVIAQAAAQIAGGARSGSVAWKAAKTNYKQMRQTADQIRKESREEAARIRFEADKFAKNQMMGFISSGVTGEGTPTLLTKETYAFGEKEAKAVIEAGKREALNMDRQAKVEKAQGKAAIISSISGGASSASSAFANMKK